MAEPVARAKNVWFSYGSAPVLRDVDLAVQPGELIAVVGPNGGGKTTLLKLLLGLLEPDRGEVVVLGDSPARSRCRVGYVPQYASFDPAFPIRVADVVLMGMLGRTRRFGPYMRSDRRAAAEALEDVQLSRLARRPFAQLSGGERQRVLIARALVSRPALLLMDEPTANLDAGVSEEFHELLQRLTARMAIVMVSHDMGFVSDAFQKVVCVRETVSVHPTADLGSETIRELYGQDIRLVRHDHNCTRDCPGGEDL